MSPGQIAYEAYNDALGYRGSQIDWQSVTPEHSRAWEAVAQAVLAQYHTQLGHAARRRGQEDDDDA